MLGPVGVVTGGVTAVHEFAEGKKADGTYDAISTGLGAAALVTPPPADLACGAAAGAMALVKIVDPDIANQAVEGAKEVGHAVSSAASSVKNFVGGLF